MYAGDARNRSVDSDISDTENLPAHIRKPFRRQKTLLAPASRRQCHRPSPKMATPQMIGDDKENVTAAINAISSAPRTGLRKSDSMHSMVKIENGSIQKSSMKSLVQRQSTGRKSSIPKPKRSLKNLGVGFHSAVKILEPPTMPLTASQSSRKPGIDTEVKVVSPEETLRLKSAGHTPHPNMTTMNHSTYKQSESVAKLFAHKYALDSEVKPNEPPDRAVSHPLFSENFSSLNSVDSGSVAAGPATISSRHSEASGPLSIPRPARATVAIQERAPSTERPRRSRSASRERELVMKTVESTSVAQQPPIPPSLEQVLALDDDDDDDDDIHECADAIAKTTLSMGIASQMAQPGSQGRLHLDQFLSQASNIQLRQVDERSDACDDDCDVASSITGSIDWNAQNACIDVHTLGEKVIVKEESVCMKADANQNDWHWTKSCDGLADDLLLGNSPNNTQQWTPLSQCNDILASSRLQDNSLSFLKNQSAFQTALASVAGGAIDKMEKENIAPNSPIREPSRQSRPADKKPVHKSPHQSSRRSHSAPSVGKGRSVQKRSPDDSDMDHRCYVEETPLSTPATKAAMNRAAFRSVDDINVTPYLLRPADLTLLRRLLHREKENVDTTASKLEVIASLQQISAATNLPDESMHNDSKQCDSGSVGKVALSSMVISTKKFVEDRSSGHSHEETYCPAPIVRVSSGSNQPKVTRDTGIDADLGFETLSTSACPIMLLPEAQSAANPKNMESTPATVSSMTYSAPSKARTFASPMDTPGSSGVSLCPPAMRARRQFHHELAQHSLPSTEEPDMLAKDAVTSASVATQPCARGVGFPADSVHTAALAMPERPTPKSPLMHTTPLAKTADSPAPRASRKAGNKSTATKPKSKSKSGAEDTAQGVEDDKENAQPSQHAEIETPAPKVDILDVKSTVKAAAQAVQEAMVDVSMLNTTAAEKMPAVISALLATYTSMDSMNAAGDPSPAHHTHHAQELVDEESDEEMERGLDELLSTIISQGPGMNMTSPESAPLGSSVKAAPGTLRSRVSYSSSISKLGMPQRVGRENSADIDVSTELAEERKTTRTSASFRKDTIPEFVGFTSPQVSRCGAAKTTSPLSEGTSGLMTAATTITIDQSFANETMYSNISDDRGAGMRELKAAAGSKAPRLTLVSKRKHRDASDDMKEISMETIPGTSTTIVLTFSNNRERPMAMRSRAIDMRFEAHDPKDRKEGDKKLSAFDVSPREMSIGKDQSKSLYVTFSPVAGREGIYTGVLKIKASKKTFVMLLRGEAYLPKSPDSEDVINEHESITADGPMMTVSDTKATAPSAVPATVVEPDDPVDITEMTMNTETNAVKALMIMANAAATPYSTRAEEDGAVESTSVLQLHTRQAMADSCSQVAYAEMSTSEKSLHTRQEWLREWIQRTKERNAMSDESVRMKGVPHDNQFTAYPDILSVAESCPAELYLRNGTSRATSVNISSSSKLLQTSVGHAKITVPEHSECRIEVYIGSAGDLSEHPLDHVGYLLVTADSGNDFMIDVRRGQLAHWEQSYEGEAGGVLNSFTSQGDTSSVHAASLTDAAQQMEQSVYTQSHSLTSNLTQSDAFLTATKSLQEGRDHMDSMSFHTFNNRSALQSMYAGIGMQSFTGYTAAASAGAALFKAISESRSRLEKGKDVSSQNRSKDASRVSTATLPVANSRRGVYFKKAWVDFGSVGVGSLTRLKIELCNATDKEVTVYLGDPTLPFVLLHNEVKLRPKCFARVPVRFVPVAGPQEYSCELHAQSADGAFYANTLLSGVSF